MNTISIANPSTAYRMLMALLLSFVLLAAASATANSAEQQRTAEIGGEAASYEGVTVRFVAGRQAIMTVYEADGTEVEKIPMHTLKTKEEMHALMQQKGFRLKNSDEVARIQAEHKQEQDAETKQREERLNRLRTARGEKRSVVEQSKPAGLDVVESSISYGKMFALYGMMGMALVVLAVQKNRKRRRNK